MAMFGSDYKEGESPAFYRLDRQNAELAKKVERYEELLRFIETWCRERQIGFIADKVANALRVQNNKYAGKPEHDERGWQPK